MPEIQIEICQFWPKFSTELPTLLYFHRRSTVPGPSTSVAAALGPHTSADVARGLHTSAALALDPHVSAAV